MTRPVTASALEAARRYHVALGDPGLIIRAPLSTALVLDHERVDAFSATVSALPRLFMMNACVPYYTSALREIKVGLY